MGGASYLDPNEYCRVLEQQGDWYRVQYYNSGRTAIREGWVPNKYVRYDDMGAPSVSASSKEKPANLPTTGASNSKSSSGLFPLYDNRRHDPTNPFHETFFDLSGSAGFNFEFSPGEKIKPSDLTVGVGASLTLMTGAWEFDYLDIGLLNFGNASAFIGALSNYSGIGASVSIWSPEITLKLKHVNITLGFDVGSIGFKAGVVNGQYQGGISYGWGAHIGISFH